MVFEYRSELEDLKPNELLDQYEQVAKMKGMTYEQWAALKKEVDSIPTK